MKSIKTKILMNMVTSLAIVALSIGIVSSYMSYNGTLNTLSETMSQIATAVAHEIKSDLQSYKNIAIETGSNQILANPNIPIAEKGKILTDKAQSYGFNNGFIVDASGKNIFDSQNVSDQDYFKEAIKGTAYITPPMISKSTGENIVMVSAPLWENGKRNSKIIGVVCYSANGDFLSNIVKDIKVGKSGSGYINDENGTVIAHKNTQLVLDQENVQEQAKTDKALKTLANLENKMMEGKTGFSGYSYGGVKKFLSYAPIPDTNGWSLGINTEQKEFTAATINSIIIMLIITVVLLMIAIFFALRIANRIANPIKACADRLLLLSQGDLHTEVPATTAKDETGTLLSSLKATVSNLTDAISDVSYHLGEISKGNLSSSVTLTYKGDFKPLEVSVKNILSSLNDAMNQINQSSEQVNSGAEQVSSAAQALSQGATEQASSIQELSATINDISTQISENAKNASNAKSISVTATTEVEKGNHKMQEMVSAMSEISKSSTEIGKIIKTIDDIAFQTNILALNAAVEAARAGTAGKGFAVVADEVRNLAQKSATAAMNTTQLIEDSVKAVSNGSKIAEETAQSLNTIIDGAIKSTALIEQIAAASNEQANAVIQVMEGVEQISAVIQTNSATAEESAAASEELSGQSQMLKLLVNNFKLNENNQGISEEAHSSDSESNLNTYENYADQSFSCSKY